MSNNTVTFRNTFIAMVQARLSVKRESFCKFTHTHFYVTSRGINTEDLKSSGSKSEDNFDEGSELNEDGTESDDDGAGI